MRKKSFFLLITTLCQLVSFSQTATFLKTYSNTPSYGVYSMPYCGLDTMSRNSFITSGCKLRFSTGTSDTCVLDSYIQKTEISGLTNWFRMYHLYGYAFYLRDAKVLNNKDILCSGMTNDFYTPDGSIKHGILMKTDSNGFVQWCHLFPRQKLYKLLERSDGNIGVIAADSGGSYGKNLKLALINPAGNLLWCKRLLSPDSGFYGVNIIEGKNKSFLINANYNLMILLDSIGNHINDLTFSPVTASQGFYRAINYYDQCFYIAGYNYNSSLLATITKTDLSLNLIWHKAYKSSISSNSEFHNIMALSPNNLLLFCEPEGFSFNPVMQRTGFAFFDTSGIFKKSHIFTSDSFPVLPEDFIKLNNGKILLTAFSSQLQYFGIIDTASTSFCKRDSVSWSFVPSAQPVNTNSFTSVNSTLNYYSIPVLTYQPFDLNIVYKCSTGPSGPTYIDEENKGEKITLFPSPSSDFLYIQINSETKRNKQISFKVYNSIGQKVMDDKFFLESKFFLIDLRSFAEGVYYFVYNFDSGNPTTEKIIVTKK